VAEYALFSGMASFIKRVADRGEIEIMICGGGSLKRTWDDAEQSEPGAAGSHTWFPYLRDASQCANSVSAPQASSSHLQDAAGRTETGREPAELNEYLALPRNVLASTSRDCDFHHGSIY